LSAKSRRDGKPIFEFPEFDKEEYIRKEFRDAKTSRMVIVLAMVIALISYGLVRIDSSLRIVGLLLVFMAVASLKEFFQMIRIDISAFEKKNWIGNSLLLFFAWFGMFTLLLNPPFTDMIDPKVESINLYSLYNETSDNVTYLNDPTPDLNTNISINATVKDNSQVENVTLIIKYPDGREETRYMWETKARDDEYTGGLMRLDQEGSYAFTVKVEDDYGNKGEKTKTIKVEP